MPQGYDDTRVALIHPRSIDLAMTLLSSATDAHLFEVRVPVAHGGHATDRARAAVREPFRHADRGAGPGVDGRERSTRVVHGNNITPWNML